MKKILLLFVFVSTVVIINAQAPTADEVLKPVYAKAAREGKNVLLMFHASWCGWCKKMDSSLADKSIASAIQKNYVVTQLIVYESAGKKALENPGALALLTRLGGADKGLPFWYVLDSKGKLLAGSELKPNENTGCPSTKEEVAYLVEVLDKTGRFTNEELEKVRERFRKNEQ